MGQGLFQRVILIVLSGLIFCGLLCGRGWAEGWERAVKIMLPSNRPDIIASVSSGGGRLLARRGYYEVFSLPESLLPVFSSLPSVQPRPDFDRIMLKRQTIDVRKGLPPVPFKMRSAGEGGLLLVQFTAPPLDEELGLLTEAGARIIHFVPQNAYLIWVDPAGKEKLQALNERDEIIQFLDDYHPYYAVSPRLDPVLEDGSPVEVTVQIFNYGPSAWDVAAEVVEGSRRVITPPREALRGRYINLRVALPGTSLIDVARLPGVVWVEPYQPPGLLGERQDQIVAGNLNGPQTQPAGPGYLNWLSNRGFPAAPSSYPIVDIVDDGFDNGNASSPANSEFRELNQPANPSRVQYANIAPGAGFWITSPNGVAGHGNINCSIVGGYNNGSGTPAHHDAAGYHYGLGVSPYGRLASTKVFTDSGWWPWGINEATMVNNQYGAGVRISSNSWGEIPGSGGYTTDSQNYDGWTRDARSGTAGNQEMLFVFAAGNSGPSGTTVSWPGTAKNVITVGASENYNLTGTDGCFVTNSEADNLQDIVDFSGRGPCDDGRVKPDLVAPGTHIHGAASYDSSYDGSGVCDQYNPVGQTKYCLSSGTSHSTPAISGCASLSYNFLNRVYSIGTPSPALLKAYLLHSGRHLTGVSANDNFPSNNQGYGLVDLGFALAQNAERFFLDQTEVFHSSGETYEFSGTVDKVSEPVRVALVWTDEPGPTSGDAYVNNLDLEVTVGGTLYRGNNFIKGLSTGGGSADTRNNTECVFLPAGTSGNIAVTVKATGITGDGLPGNGDLTDQDFALVIYNVTTTPQYLALDSGDYNGDGTSDIAVFRPASGLWSIRNLTRCYFGGSSDLPVPGDYDGDATTNVAVFRDSNGLWGIKGLTRFYLGSPSDLPVPGDYDGDGSSDAGIFRPSNGLWVIRNVTRLYFGSEGDLPVPGDYDGAGSKDIAIYRGMNGYWALAGISRFYFGSSGDRAVPGDYDGDGTFEAGIFRSSSGSWAIRGVTRSAYGSSSDQPVPADYDGDSADNIGIFRESNALWAVRGTTRLYHGLAGDIPVTR